MREKRHSVPSKFLSTRAQQCGFAAHDCFHPPYPMTNILRFTGTKLSFDSFHLTVAETKFASKALQHVTTNVCKLSCLVSSPWRTGSNGDGSERAGAPSRQHTLLSSAKAGSRISQVPTNTSVLYLTAPGLALVGGQISPKGSATAQRGQGQHTATSSPTSPCRDTRLKKLEFTWQPKFQPPYRFLQAQFVPT